MKLYKTLPAIASLVLMLASVQANANGLTYDSCGNYYTDYYGIDMTSDEIVAHETTTAVPSKQQPITSIEIRFYSDPRNYSNW